MPEVIEWVSHRLTDAQEMQRLHTDTFEAPDADELKSIAPGDGVKICVDDCERFWTVVQSVTEHVIVARVDNHLTLIDWEVGKKLAFETRHVYVVVKRGEGEGACVP
ncbi:hypothetical protein OAO87_00385 [bacterium]|nr:hypothetical protein [bacterium]